MKKLILLTVIGLCCSAIVRAQYQDVKEKKTEGNRPLAEFVKQQKVLWNFDWDFSFGKEQKEWRHVDLPHDFQFEQPWDRAGGLWARGFKAMGCGWYRRRLFADPAWRGKRVALDFGGILCESEVYLNGEKMAEDDYGYLGFEVDVSNRLR